jgi:hypothetical protein
MRKVKKKGPERRQKRRFVFPSLTARIHLVSRSADRWKAADVKNLSSTGALITVRTPQIFVEGVAIEMEVFFPGGADGNLLVLFIHGQVMRKKGGRCAINFTKSEILRDSMNPIRLTA